jgi:hypothetical protein
MLRRFYSQESGFVLVTSLLVLVALAVLGAGSFFLASANLRIAENTRTSTIAQYNAHQGLDIALQVVAREFYERGDGSWPSSSELAARMPVSPDFEFKSLVLDPVNADGFRPGGSITVVGYGPRNARYETGARFVGQLTPVQIPGEADPLFGTGWVTDAHITINGNTSFYIPLWAGGNITANATRVLAGAGQFAHAGFVGGKPAQCKIFSGGPSGQYVRCDSGQEPPNVPEFNFDEQLAALQAERPVCTATITTSGSVSASGYVAGSTICLGEGVTVTITGTATDLYILGPRSATVIFDAKSQPVGGDPTKVGVKIAVGRITPGNNFNLSGTNTLYAAESILFHSTGYAVTGTSTDAGVIVRTLIGTEKGVHFKGNTAGQLSSVIWANGHVCKSGGGGLDFAGTILARGQGPVDLENPCTEGIYWNGGGGGKVASVESPDIPSSDDDAEEIYAAAGIVVVARRP